MSSRTSQTALLHYAVPLIPLIGAYKTMEISRRKDGKANHERGRGEQERPTEAKSGAPRRRKVTTRQATVRIRNKTSSFQNHISFPFISLFIYDEPLLPLMAPPRFLHLFHFQIGISFPTLLLSFPESNRSKWPRLRETAATKSRLDYLESIQVARAVTIAHLERHFVSTNDVRHCNVPFVSTVHKTNRPSCSTQRAIATTTLSG
ncbi:hypothetical protein C8J56DRAFT_51425 [Mycena floridula]|nr:hypothetical protein C8J56DRAFT_51425 [Mycena floridula]